MKLTEYLKDFEDLEPEERLEVLVDFASTLPPLSGDQVHLPQQESCRIQECQTPVYLACTVENGHVQLAAHVPEKSPTVRGFVALLVTGLSGATPEEVLAICPQIPAKLGLQEVLGMTRVRGFSGILDRIVQAVRRNSA